MTKPELDLDSMDALELRKTCTQFCIAWRNFRGKNKHMKSDTMRFQIRQRLQLTA